MSLLWIALTVIVTYAITRCRPVRDEQVSSEWVRTQIRERGYRQQP